MLSPKISIFAFYLLLYTTYLYVIYALFTHGAQCEHMERMSVRLPIEL